MSLFYFLLSECHCTNDLFYREDSNEEVLLGCYGSCVDIVIPKTVKEIADDAFWFTYYCENEIRSVSFEENSELISIYNFSFTHSKIESADLSNCNKLSFLNGSIFDSCWYLETVKLPKNITSIGDRCFYDCELKSIELPESLTYIGDSAFSLCPFTNITLPKKINIYWKFFIYWL